MAEPSTPADDMIEVELRNPVVAAILAWLWPGAGHMYQARYGKGLLFMICILSLWFFGLALADGHSVYASNRTIPRRLVFGCQVAVGLPAAPAVVQAALVSRGQPVKWNGFMAPPIENGYDELSEWSFKYGALLDMGVLYTMIAGLLNVLAIFDAYGGPFVPPPEEKKPEKKSDKQPPETASGGTPPNPD